MFLLGLRICKLILTFMQKEKSLEIVYDLTMLSHFMLLNIC